MISNHDKLCSILEDKRRNGVLPSSFSYKYLLRISTENIDATLAGQSYSVLRALQGCCTCDDKRFNDYRNTKDPRKYPALQDVKNSWMFSLRPVVNESKKHIEKRTPSEEDAGQENAMLPRDMECIRQVPDYLIDNVDRIRRLGEQDLGRWKASYDHQAFEQFEVMSRLRERFPHRRITRTSIVQLFRDEEYYLGFFAAMVWGFINATRPRPNVDGDGRAATDLYRALSHPQHAIEAAINYAVDRFREQDYVTPFQAMRRGEMHNIPGVDYPYFTKMFFFVGQAFNGFIIKPLIFDKWTKNAFFALLSQSNPREVGAYFSTVRNSKNPNRPGEVSVRSGENLIQAYNRYIELMNQWANTIDVPPDRLEQFVFGYDLRQGDTLTNPRTELWRIVDENRALSQRRTIKCQMV